MKNLFDGLKRDRCQSGVAVIDTVPIDCHNPMAINAGLEIVRKYYDADVYHFRETIPHEYNTYAFNVFYPMQLINVIPSIVNNNLLGNHIILGGQGVSNLPADLSGIGKVFLGELDGLERGFRDSNGFYRKTGLDSDPIIRNDKAVVELTRGCKHKCSFCEYSHIGGGLYREKPIQIVKEQIYEVMKRGVRQINFMSSNISGYSSLDVLLDHCLAMGINVSNRDVCFKDIGRIHPFLKPLKITNLKIGVESFDEATRERVNKRITDDELFHWIEELSHTCSALHFYLIYGLPGDDYEKWFKAVERLGKIRESITRPIRYNFSITNFEPCRNTPLEKAARIDFKEKEAFMKKWYEVMSRNRFYQSAEFNHTTSQGRLGRKEESYEMLMAIKDGGKELAPVLLRNLFKSGIKRSVSTAEAVKFLKAIEEER